MRRNMPSLVALRAFEAVGRTGSVRAAGDELAVSHTAVSRHVRNLQSNLGSALICPSGRGVALTREGRDFFNALSGAFDEIERALGVLRPPQKTIRIWCVPGIANRRLLARLPELTGPPRNWEVMLNPTLDRPNLMRREADAEIIYRNDHLPPAQIPVSAISQTVARPRVFPVASPAFIARYPRLRAAEDLLKAPLLHEDSADQWAVWLRLAGVPVDGQLPGQRLWHAHLAIESARLGHGLAIANEILVHDELRSGALVEPFASEIYPGSYEFVALRERWGDRDISGLRSWLQSALASDRYL